MKVFKIIFLFILLILPIESLPQAVRIAIGDDPVKGDSYAPVVIVEFSDFECPFCKKFSRTTEKKIEKDYIKKGIVRLVFKDFPLIIHQFAFLAAQSANCVIKTGKYWQMHEALMFAEELDPLFIENLAKKYGLTSKEYENCINSKSVLNEINGDIKEGRSAGINGTPSFVIGNETQKGIVEGELIVGAQPYEKFTALIEKFIKPVRIHFPTGSYEIPEKAKGFLKGFAEYLQKHSDLQIVIEGHTDQRGSKESNFILGRKRAEAVRNYLSTLGIENQRMKIKSYGETKPIDTGRTESAYAKNRRVEIILVK